MPNMANIIAANNKKVFNNINCTAKETRLCDTELKSHAHCPIIAATRRRVLSHRKPHKDVTMKYYVLCDIKFKSRFYNNTQSFEHGQKAKITNSESSFGKVKMRIKSHHDKEISSLRHSVSKRW